MKSTKRILCVALACIMCVLGCSCSIIRGVQLKSSLIASAAEKMSVNSYNDYYNDADYREFVVQIQRFSARLSASLVEKYGASENIAISPVSVYMALALACECANGETRQEILDAVGVSYDDVSRYTKRLYAFCNQEFKSLSAFETQQIDAYESLNNSIWLDEGISYVQSGIDSLANNYNCDSFRTNFASGDGEKLIGEYIKEKTHGLIDGSIDLDAETVFVLMNTFYLKEIWNATGADLGMTKEYYDFKSTDGETVKTKLLEGYYNMGHAINSSDHVSFFTQTEHGFKIYFLVPTGDHTAAEIMNNSNISAVVGRSDWNWRDDDKREEYYTRVVFPEFKAEFDDDIKSVLMDDFGIESLFDIDRCDVSNVFAEDAFCNQVIHRASLEVNKKGIEGAAVTIMEMCGAAAPNEEYTKIYETLVVDRAFGFVLTDSYGTVLFSGVINNLK